MQGFQYEGRRVQIRGNLQVQTRMFEEAVTIADLLGVSSQGRLYREDLWSGMEMKREVDLNVVSCNFLECI